MNTKQAYELLIKHVKPEYHEGFAGFTPTNAYRAIMLQTEAGAVRRQIGTQGQACLACYLTRATTHGEIMRWFGLGLDDNRYNVVAKLGLVNGEVTAQRASNQLIDTKKSGKGENQVFHAKLTDAGKALLGITAKQPRKRPSKVTEAPAEAEAEVAPAEVENAV